jgi:predicted site-specific integrase-resolvase
MADLFDGPPPSPQQAREAALEELTGVSRWTWRRWACEGKVASVKLGNRLLIPVSECERLVKEGMRPALKVE